MYLCTSNSTTTLQTISNPPFVRNICKSSPKEKCLTIYLRLRILRMLTSLIEKNHHNYLSLASLTKNL
jgi:hypothetical protein